MREIGVHRDGTADESLRAPEAIVGKGIPIPDLDPTTDRLTAFNSPIFPSHQWHVARTQADIVRRAGAGVAAFGIELEIAVLKVCNGRCRMAKNVLCAGGWVVGWGTGGCGEGGNPETTVGETQHRATVSLFGSVWTRKAFRSQEFRGPNLCEKGRPYYAPSSGAVGFGAPANLRNPCC